MEEIKSLTEAMRRLAETEDFKKVMEGAKRFFRHDEPSSAIAKFQSNETFYIDGTKAGLRFFEQLERGDFLEESKQETEQESYEEFTSKNQL